MSIIFFDGFDYYGSNSFGPGGRHWDQGSFASTSVGRFGGQCVTFGVSSCVKTFSVSTSQLIVGFAMLVDDLDDGQAFLVFYDHNTPQCSMWLSSGGSIIVRTGLGNGISDITLGDTGFVPPLTLWFYIEIKVTIGNPGACEVRIDSTTVATFTGIQTQQSGSPTTNKISFQNLDGSVDTGEWYCDDLYVINTQDATNNVDYLGEVRVQTKLPDAEGYEDDFLPSSGSNWQNVDATTTSYVETGNYNYSGTVNAVDSYSIANFTISGTIFAVQSNLSFRKDDVGNRVITPTMRTASTNYTGASFPCYSSYTYAGAMWEINPNTGLPWILTDLNAAEFGIKVVS